MKISVILPIIMTPTQKAKLIQLGVDYFAEHPMDMKNDHSASLMLLSDADIIVIGNTTPMDAEFLSSHPHLKLIQTVTAGLDHIDLDAAVRNNIAVKALTNYSVEAVAEKTIGMIIFGANRIQEANIDVKNGNWNFRIFRGKELRGTNLAVVGYGNIGKRVAQLAKSFGMNVLIVNSRTAKDDFYEILSTADFVTIHAPLTPDTFHLFNQKAFSQMKDGVVFVNNSRGALVDEVALLEALECKKIKFASLDVLEQFSES